MAGTVALVMGGAFATIVVVSLITASSGGYSFGTMVRVVAAFAFLAVGWRLFRTPGHTAQGRTADSPPTAREARPIPQPAPGTRYPVDACMMCGANELRPQTLGDGLAAGGSEMLRYVCNRCGTQGQPIRFDDEAGYARFVRELNEAPDGRGASVDGDAGNPTRPGEPKD